MSKLEAKSSGWTLYLVKRFELNVNYFDPISGLSYIELLEEIKCINVKNEDHKCFMWAIKSALYTPQKDLQRFTKYKDIGPEIDEA